jgi:hypothetical protein
MFLVLLAQNAIPVMSLVWFFSFEGDAAPAKRFGPYLSEGTCEAVRTRFMARAQVVSQTGRGSSVSPCFKVSVQEREQIED